MKWLFIIAAALLLSFPAMAQDAPATLPDSFTIPSANAPAAQPAAPAVQAAPGGGASATGTAANQKPMLFNKLFDSLPRDIQDEIMAEATGVEKTCSKNNIYSYFHDCECLGTKFLEQRLNHPDAAKDNLSYAIRAECVNQPGIAGYSYDYCFKQFAYMMPSNFGDKQKDVTCKCYARLMAKRYSDAPNPSYSYISDMQVAAINDCLDQATTPAMP